MFQSTSRRVLTTLARTATSTSSSHGCSSLGTIASHCRSNSSRALSTAPFSTTLSSESAASFGSWESSRVSDMLPRESGKPAELLDLETVAAVFRGVNVNTVLRRVPRVLDPERMEEVAAMMRGMQEAMPGVDVPALIVALPEVLDLDLEADLLPRIRTLKNLLPGASFVHGVSASPEVLITGPSRVPCSSLEA